MNGADFSMDWTPAEWENLQQQSDTLRRLLAENRRSNSIWRTALRLTITTIAAYLPAEEGRNA